MVLKGDRRADAKPTGNWKRGENAGQEAHTYTTDVRFAGRDCLPKKFKFFRSGIIQRHGPGATELGGPLGALA